MIFLSVWFPAFSWQVRPERNDALGWDMSDRIKGRAHSSCRRISRTTWRVSHVRKMMSEARRMAKYSIAENGSNWMTCKITPLRTRP